MEVYRLKKPGLNILKYCTFLFLLLMIFSFANGLTGCNIVGKKDGNQYLPETTGNNVTVVPEANEEYVQPVIPEIPIELTPQNLESETKADKKGKKVVIASYTTKLLDRSNNRINNIDIASEKLNKKLINPGEEFSFNKAVGRRTEAKGYEEAPIIIMTEDGPEKSEGVGGGVCQLSTTLFNAVEEAKLKITERHLHSKKIGYVPKGEDATVVYGKMDFKFINTRENPIEIRVKLTKKSLTVKLFEIKD